MRLRVLADASELARTAAEEVASILAARISARGTARLVAATGTSQLPLLEALAAQRTVDWGRVELFHLDEYLGLPSTHPASFAAFVRDRIVQRFGVGRAHLLDGLANPVTHLAEVGAALRSAPVDLLLAGIGENGHLAFNDPPADLECDEPFLLVTLDHRNRLQQVRQGWFKTLAEVPERAITLSVRQVLRADRIVCVATGARKAEAVKACFGGGVTPHAPASALLGHAGTTVYLDPDSAALLPLEALERLGR